MVLICPFGNFGFVDFPLQIAFVSDKDYDCIFCFDSAQIVPLFDSVFKGGFPGVVKDQDDAMATFKVGRDNGPVLFLAGSVPDVEFGEFVVEVDIFDFEIDGSDLGLLLSEEVAFGESPKQSRLAHITVTDKNELVLFFLSI